MIEVVFYSAVAGTSLETRVYNSDNGLVSVKFSAKKFPLLNEMMQEAQRASIELVADDWLISLFGTHTTYLDVSYYDIVVNRDGNKIYQGVLPLNTIKYDYSSEQYSLTAYSYEFLLKKLDQEKSITPKFSRDCYLDAFRSLIRSKFKRNELLEYPDYLTSYVQQEFMLYNPVSITSNSICDEGLLNTSYNIFDDHYNVIDRCTRREFRSIVWRAIPEFTNRIRYKIQRTVTVVEIYNQSCVDVIRKDSEILSKLYDSISDALDDVPDLRNDLEYYEDDSWLNLDEYQELRIINHKLYFNGNICPLYAVFEDNTSYLDMLKSHLLIYNLSVVMTEDNKLNIIKNSYPNYTYNDVTDRVTSLTKTRFNPSDIDLSVLDSLKGNASYLKEYLLDKYNDFFSSIIQFDATIDDINNDDIHLNDVININSIQMRVVEVKIDIINDEYNAILWRI